MADHPSLEVLRGATESRVFLNLLVNAISTLEASQGSNFRETLNFILCEVKEFWLKLSENGQRALIS
jgi:hypothetical protein